jgi:hypothetical protein
MELAFEWDPAKAAANVRKYAARYAQGTNLVPLDPDVAAAFPDPAEVNAVLRAVAGIIHAHQPPGAPEPGGGDPGEAAA